MRRLSYAVARGVVALSVVVALAAPAFAVRPADGPRDGIVKIIKKMVVKALGDFLTVPRP